MNCESVSGTLAELFGGPMFRGPLRRQMDYLADSNPALRASPLRARPRGQPSVLIVEDDPAVARAIHRVLAHEPWQFRSVKSCEEARLLIATLPYFDVAVIDIHLKDGSGIEIGQELLAAGAMGEAVIFSADLGTDSEDARALGTFVHKTEGPERLRDAVRSAMDRVR